MSISKERLNEIALEVWADGFAGRSEEEFVYDFAHALLKAVEVECEVVGYQSKMSGNIDNEGGVVPDWYNKLIALPLVSEE